MSEFKIGDRVLYINPDHACHGKYGIVKAISCATYEVSFGQISVVDRYSSFQLAAIQTHRPEKDYTVKCAEWFKSAYAAITKAGGCPEYLIGDIPADLLETLIRNDLHLEYKK